MRAGTGTHGSLRMDVFWQSLPMMSTMASTMPTSTTSGATSARDLAIR